MPLTLPHFERQVALVEESRVPTSTFHRWWQTVVRNLITAFTKIEQQTNDLSVVVADLQAVVDQQTIMIADIQAAQTAADAAQLDATAAAREAARINSYPSPSSVLIAADAGTDASITIENHTRVYPVQGAIDVPDVAITGATIGGLAFSTKYFVYYDDSTLTATAPTFLVTTASATAQVGAAAGRHFLGTVTTPADGGTSTTGTGSTAPGGTTVYS